MVSAVSSMKMLEVIASNCRNPDQNLEALCVLWSLCFHTACKMRLTVWGYFVKIPRRCQSLPLNIPQDTAPQTPIVLLLSWVRKDCSSQPGEQRTEAKGRNVSHATLLLQPAPLDYHTVTAGHPGPFIDRVCAFHRLPVTPYLCSNLLSLESSG